MTSITDSINIFTFELKSQLETKYCWSPYSLYSVLIALLFGSNGDTGKQLVKCLHFSHVDILDHLTSLNAELSRFLQISNHIFVEEEFPIIENFIKQLRSLNITITPQSFKTDPGAFCQNINTIISQATGGLISQLLGDGIITTSTRLVITNTVYFNAKWEYPFSHDATRNHSFTRSSRRSGTVEMMMNREMFSYHENDNCQIVELKYRNPADNYSMIFVLPRKDSKFELKSYDQLKRLIQQLQLEDVYAQIPRFSQQRNYNFVAPLKQLGVTDIFDETLADLTGISEKEDLYVTNICQQVKVIVDEMGTIAAAASCVAVAAAGVCGSYKEPKVFRADHSFYYFIRHIPSSTILFSGYFDGYL